MPELSQKLIEDAVNDRAWDFANGVLYQLCKNHPEHTREDIIIAKIWLIGRAYAAAVERRKESRGNSLSGEFYTKQVGPLLNKSGIDSWFSEFKDGKLRAVQLHKKITNLLFGITKLDKRSLVSKYLHFHFPDKIYIYDSYAKKAAVEICNALGKRRFPRSRQDDVDQAYTQFCDRCCYVSERISERIDRHLSPRELDKLLLHWHRISRAEELRSNRDKMATTDVVNRTVLQGG